MINKIDWVVLGGLALGGIVGVFLLHSVVPVVAKPAEVKRMVASQQQEPSAYPWDSDEGFNWDLNMEKLANSYDIEATQSPYWKTMANEYYNPHNVY